MRTLAVFGLFAAAAMAQPVRMYVIGDSTASNGPERGWSSHLQKYVGAGTEVVNRARAGRSSRTFVTEGLWDRVREELRPGDFVLIQFGHNDGGPLFEDRARGSLPGLGAETQRDVHTFGWYLRKYIEETRAKGATPIVLSPTVRNIWKGIAVERGPGKYAEWSAEVARSTGAAFLPVTDAIADRYEDMGQEQVKPLFPEDHTHTNPKGADLVASIVADVLAGRWPMEIPEKRLNLPRPRNAKLPTLFLIGDSTVRNGHGDGAGGQWGWGEPLFERFDAAKVNVVNRAVGGLSSRTYLTQGHWAHVLTMLTPGDIVVMQFGHNDNGPVDDERARGTLAGTGDETRSGAHTYGWYLRRYIEDARAKGAIPVVCSLVPRKIWKDGKIVRNSTTFQKWAAEVAAAERAPFIDLNELIARRYDALGEKAVEPLFADEHTHTSRAGAELNADVVIEGLKRLQDLPLADWLK
jgi:lysophospholipase L1-like esterase